MYFSIIPQHVSKQKKLGEARFLYAHILTLSSKHGYCYASNNYLSDIMECDSRSITRYVKILVSAKLIQVQYNENKSRVIIPIDTFIGQKLAPNKINGIIEVDPEVDALLDDIWKKMKTTKNNSKQLNNLKQA